MFGKVTLSINIAQKPYIIGSLGPKALNYESFDAKGEGGGQALSFKSQRWKVESTQTERRVGMAPCPQAMSTSISSTAGG